MGLVPFVAIEKLLGLPTARMEAIIGMGQLLLDRDLMKDARTLENLGIDGMTPEEFLQYVKTGQR